MTRLPFCSLFYLQCGHADFAGYRQTRVSHHLPFRFSVDPLSLLSASRPCRLFSAMLTPASLMPFPLPSRSRETGVFLPLLRFGPLADEDADDQGSPKRASGYTTSAVARQLQKSFTCSGAGSGNLPVDHLSTMSDSSWRESQLSHVSEAA